MGRATTRWVGRVALSLAVVAAATIALAAELMNVKLREATVRSGPKHFRSAVETLTRSVIPPFRSRTKTSGAALVSPATRLEALDAKATKRPSALREGS